MSSAENKYKKMSWAISNSPDPDHSTVPLSASFSSIATLNGSTNFTYHSVITMCESRSQWFIFCEHVIYCRKHYCRYRGTRYCRQTSVEEAINDFCPCCWARVGQVAMKSWEENIVGTLHTAGRCAGRSIISCKRWENIFRAIYEKLNCRWRLRLHQLPFFGE
jgi:hypothetical protein